MSPKTIKIEINKVNPFHYSIKLDYFYKLNELCKSLRKFFPFFFKETNYIRLGPSKQKIFTVNNRINSSIKNILSYS